MPENFNTKISHQLFYYKIKPLWIYNSRTQIQRWLCTQKTVIKVCFKDLWFAKIIWLRFFMTNNRHLSLAIHNTIFYPLIIINCIRQTKSESKIYIILHPRSYNNNDIFSSPSSLYWKKKKGKGIASRHTRVYNLLLNYACLGRSEYII